MNSVIAKWPSRCFFGGGNLDTVPQDPDRPAMQEMLHLPMQTANELLRAFKSETDQVNYDVGFQLEDALTEDTSGVLSRPVRRHLLDEAPSGMGFIWFTLGTRNIDEAQRCCLGQGFCFPPQGTCGIMFHELSVYWACSRNLVVDRRLRHQADRIQEQYPALACTKGTSTASRPRSWSYWLHWQPGARLGDNTALGRFPVAGKVMNTRGNCAAPPEARSLKGEPFFPRLPSGPS